MEQRAYHGEVTPETYASALMAEFGGGGYRAQQVGDPDHLVVQVARPNMPASGGQTSITIHLIEIEDGVMVRIGEQAWLGVAASIGVTALSALRNPFSLLGRLDDIAHDLDALQLKERIWRTLEAASEAVGASMEITEALRRISCEYCHSANPVGAASCHACGAPLGESQPVACRNCGYVSPAGAAFCAECGAELIP